jgi:glycogen debranching enzyme
MIELTKRICTNFDQSTSREWLETNGLGGFASSSIAGINTRRYHALLTAATKPPVGRMVLLSKCEETWLINGERYELSANQYSGAIHPRGFLYLKPRPGAWLSCRALTEGVYASRVPKAAAMELAVKAAVLA